MFHNHTENSPSTGEPPTPPLSSRTSGNPQISGQFSEVSSHSRLFLEPSSTLGEQSERGRSNTIPSHDSGYEMSPNLNQTDSEEFFQMEVFEDAISLDTDELCSECGETFCRCLRSPSSRNTVRSPATPSNVLCDMYFYSESFSTFQPPSSVPISIPRANAQPSTAFYETSSTSFSVGNSQRQHSNSMPAALRSSQNLQIFQQFFSRSQPRLWPTTILPSYRQNAEDFSNHRRINSPYRLRYVDSSSSLDSFFDLEPLDGVRDDVFQDCDALYDMVEEDVTFHPATDYRRRLNSEAASQPLPDLLLHASPRRSRSASVNLPPDHAVLRDIGRSLRRISDDFQTRLSGQQQSNERRVLFNNHLPGFKFLRKSDHP